MSEQNGTAEEYSLTLNDAVSEGIRLGLATSLGQTGFNDTDENQRRNHFEVFGWPRDDLDGWDEDNWLALYLRNAYAKVVNDKPAFTTWRDNPEIVENPEVEETTFESEVKKLGRNHSVWSYAERVDRAAGIGQHGLLLIGFSDIDDVDDWSDPAEGFGGLDDITTLKPVLETQIEDIDFGGPGSDRWGQPEEYLIDLSDDVDEETEDDPLTSITVHHTRVVDVPARPLLDDETFARPRAEPVLNNLLDIEKTLGAAAEAAYRSADYGLHINADPDKVDFSEGNSELRNELTRYEQDLQRYIRTQGTEVNRLGGDIQDPTGIIERNLDMISAETGIPKRELRGNAQGEQSGAEQDEKSYFGTIEERRTRYATPHIVTSLLDLLIDVGVLTAPSEGYSVEWPDLTQLSESDQAEIEANRSSVVQAVPSIAGDTAIQYLKNGADALPEPEDDVIANLDVDESDENIQADFVNRFIGNQEVDLTPPEAAQNHAQDVLDWRDDSEKEVSGMTDTGWNRAEQLASGEELSPQDIQEIAAWFARHGEEEYDLNEEGMDPWRDNGRVAIKGWGGPAMREWVGPKRRRLTEIGELEPVD